MATIIRMPEVLAGATHAVLESWSIAEGESITIGAVLAEVETEKALVELSAEADGVLYRQLVSSGDDVEVGAPVAILAAVGETEIDVPTLLGDEARPAETVPAAPTAPAAAAPALTAPTAPAAPTAPTAAAPAPVAAAAPLAQQAPAPRAEVPAASGRIFASPLVRRMVREGRIDLAEVTGTGPGGRIVRRDIEAFLAAKPAPAPAPAAAVPAAAADTGYEEVPHTRMRQAIARRLTESKSTVPHFYLTTDCVVDDLLELRRKINETAPTKISVNDFVVKAVAAAFQDVPEANVSWTDSAMRRYSKVDIAVAVATDGGLLTPVVRAVDELTLSGLSAKIAELAGRARAGRLRQEELEGGSFSVTNLGMYGTQEFSAIINPPQSGILAVGAAKQQAVVQDGELRVATVMRCTLSADHRAIDGALAARWLAAFTTRMENPLSILI